jgi:DNA-binding beta-propeller fold protein YncE
LCFYLSAPLFAQTNFVNFETAPVNPIALSPDGKTLAVCNLAAARVELFDVSNGLNRRGVVPVGIDPVTVRFRTTNEAWVVNTISDSINVIDVTTLTLRRVISTRDGPADVVFAGDPARAFVSSPPENLVQVIDPDTGAVERTIPIQGERPKALAVSADGKKVYVAILESGNGTTILAPRIADLSHVPQGGVADLPGGPYGGVNPPPNSGTNFNPAIATKLTNTPPRVGMILKKQANGHWVDDNNGDWTEFVSGTNAAFSGRVPGWDLLDHDVAVIDTTSFDTTFVGGLMNICFNLAVRPGTGELAVIGTDAINHVRYEPVLQSIFTRVNLALVGREARVFDANPHLDYITRTLPLAQRAESIGDPRAVAWNADGTRFYVAGMGSDNIAV